MFGTQAGRLLKRLWPNATMLAQELWSMFNDDVPLTQRGQLTLGDGALTVPALILHLPDNGSGDVPAVQFQTGGTPIGGITLNDGNLTFTTPQGLPQGGQQQQSGGGIPCKITGGGPGSRYAATLYPQGPGSQAGASVNVTQLQIDSGATIPPNTWTFAVSIGGAYYVSVPVWLT